uniref:Uncharacterized protein n=1 Tax=Rhizophora mucronata TaxID=61149 RepID=A0A2P2JMC8_RHIMU
MKTNNDVQRFFCLFFGRRNCKGMNVGPTDHLLIPSTDLWDSSPRTLLNASIICNCFFC